MTCMAYRTETPKMAPLPTKVVNWRQRARVGMHRLHGKGREDPR